MNCPHCNAEVANGVQFCTSCGKAVAVASATPRIVNEEKGIAASVAGQSLQGEVLQKTMKKAFTGLMVVAVLQIIGFAFFVFLYTQARTPAEKTGALIVCVVIGVLAAGFTGLAIWSRYQPFPAALTGLVILVTLWTLGAVMNPAGIAQGIVVNLIILALLVRSVQAGLAHRKLKREMAVSRAAMT